MGNGFYLTLLVGPVVPVPAPKAVLDALTGVQVTTAAGQRSGFQLTLTLAIGSSLHLLFLPPRLRAAGVGEHKPGLGGGQRGMHVAHVGLTGQLCGEERGRVGGSCRKWLEDG